MTDPFSLVGIAGAAIGPTFSILFETLRDLIVRVRRNKAGDKTKELPESPLAAIDQGAKSWIPNDERLHRMLPELQQLVGVLTPYADDPDLVRGDDPDLLSALADLHRRIEQIYGRKLQFPPASDQMGDRAVVRTDLIDTKGQHVGLRAGTFRGTLEVQHRVQGGDEGTTTYGAVIDSFGHQDQGPPPEETAP